MHRVWHRRLRWRQSCRAYVQCPEGETDVAIRVTMSPRGEAEADAKFSPFAER